MTDQLPQERRLDNKEAMMSQIFHEVDAQLAKRRTRTTWIAVAAAVTLVAVGASVALTLPRNSPVPPANPPSPTKTVEVTPTSSPTPTVTKLERIAVGKTDAPYKWAAVQAFADDIADGKEIADKCWAVRPALRGSYADIDRRKAILAQLQLTPRVDQHRLVYGKELISQDQMELDYQCTVSGQVYDVEGEQLQDVRWTLERYAGVLEGKPVNPLDTYSPFCVTTHDSAFLKDGKLTPEGKTAYLGLIRGNYEHKPMGGDSNMYIFGPVGSLDPQLGYSNGANCIYAFYPNK